MEGSPVQLEVMQIVPELFVHERMSQGTGVEGINRKKNVSGWCMEEMKEKLSIAVDILKKRKKWRGLSKTRAGRIWLTEWRRKSWTNAMSKKAKKRLLEVEVLHWNGERCAKARK